MYGSSPLVKVYCVLNTGPILIYVNYISIILIKSKANKILQLSVFRVAFRELYFLKLDLLLEIFSILLLSIQYFFRDVLLLKCLSLSLFFLFRTASLAYGSSQARGWIGAAAAGLCCRCWPMPQLQQCQIWAATSEPATSSTCTTACGNSGYLTNWVRPGIEFTSSWILCWILKLLSCNRSSDFSFF